MKIKKLYIKIFLLFFGVLIITEIMILSFFKFFVFDRAFFQISDYIKANTVIVKSAIEKYSLEEIISAQDNDAKELIVELGELYSAKIWIDEESNSEILLSSFTGDVPTIDITKMKEHNGIYFSERVRNSPAIYASHPLNLAFKNNISNSYEVNKKYKIHFYSERMKDDFSLIYFSLGLLTIGVIISFLLYYISRFITKPLELFKKSALKISAGDLDERVQIKSRDEIGELGIAFNDMVTNISKMIKSNKELTANISHELRSPLTRIRISDEMIFEELEKLGIDRLNTYISSNQKEIDDMDSLIGKILTISKLDLEIDKTRDEKIDLYELANEVIDSYDDYFVKENKILNKSSLEEKTFFTKGNREELKLVLSNIIHNSLKYSDSENNRIDFSINKMKDKFCEIKISNASKNLDVLDIDKIFTPFYRNLKEEDKIGTGLGLTICKKIIDNHGGEIVAEIDKDIFLIIVKLEYLRNEE